MKKRVPALAVLASLAVSGAALAYPPYPPVPPEVQIGPPPAPGYVVEPGHWSWVGGRYVWIPRRWIPARAGAHFVPGHWNRFGAWVPAHWAP